MLTDAELDRVCVVLVRARNPSNIGAVARAMHDFGFRHLRVVNQFAPPFEAARSAVDAADVMTNSIRCASVAEAVADCTLVVGTTAVGERHLQHPLLSLAKAAPLFRAELRAEPAAEVGAKELAERLCDNGHDSCLEVSDSAAGTTRRIALLFGSEKTGLSNDELSHCNWLLTIPMHTHAGLRHPSMNLGQAVAVCLYELVRDGDPQSEALADSLAASLAAAPLSTAAQSAIQIADPLPAAALERLTELLSKLLEETGYARRHAANSDPAQVRRLVRRIGADAMDAPVWMGILRQTLWKLSGKREE